MKSGSEAFYLSYRPAAVFKVTGEDALAFLQGQFTQELRFPGGPLCAYGLWLNQKGKVVADSFALRDGESWWLVSTDSPAAVIRERLEAYIIADDVVLEDVTEGWSGIALGGGSVPEKLAGAGVALPEAEGWDRAAGGMIFRGRRVDGPSWEWLLPVDAPLPQAIVSSDIPKGEQVDFDRMRVIAGIPKIPAELGPNDLPNEAGLEDDAVSYSKGCYLGQEVMARLKSMGQVRRKLLSVHGEGAPPALPSGLYVGAKKMGELRAAIPAGIGDAFVGLAMISLVGLDREKPLSVAPDGPALIRIAGGGV